MFLLLLLVCFLSTGQTFAQTEPTPVNIQINAEPQLFSDPMLRDERGHFLAPMAEFFQKTGIQYDLSDDGEVIAFRDNIFIKFRPHHTTYALNGKELTWDVPARYHGSTLYVSLSPFIRYTDLRATFDEETQTLHVTSGLFFEQRRSRGLLKRLDIPGSQISVSIPYFWERTEPTSFRLNPKVGHLTFDVAFEQVDPAASLREQMEKARENTSIPPEYSMFENREQLIDNNTFYTRRYRGAPDPTQILLEETPPHFPYLSFSYFRIGDQLYTFTFRSDLSDIDSQVEVEQQILESVYSKIFSVDTLSEHYVEYALFRSLNMFLESPLYSNMTLNNQLRLKGAIDPDIESLEVTLLRQERSFQYTIPVREGFFNELVPVPFGLGFHRLILSAPTAKTSDETSEKLHFGEAGTLLLKCSLINLSETEALYVSPSKEVLSRDPRVLAAVAGLDKNNLDYQNAQTLFKKLIDVYSIGEAESMREALQEKSGTPYALSLIYTAQLRAAGIASRIVRDEDSNRHFVEFYSNGEWIPTNPAGYISGSSKDERLFFNSNLYDPKKTKALDI